MDAPNLGELPSSQELRSMPIMDLAQNCATQSQQQNEIAISSEAATGHQVSDNAPFVLGNGFAPIPKKLAEKKSYNGIS